MRNGRFHPALSPLAALPSSVALIDGKVVLYASPHVLTMSPQVALDLARRIEEAVAQAAVG